MEEDSESLKSQTNLQLFNVVEKVESTFLSIQTLWLRDQGRVGATHSLRCWKVNKKPNFKIFRKQLAMQIRKLISNLLGEGVVSTALGDVLRWKYYRWEGDHSGRKNLIMNDNH